MGTWRVAGHQKDKNHNQKLEIFSKLRTELGRDLTISHVCVINSPQKSQQHKIQRASRLWNTPTHKEGVLSPNSWRQKLLGSGTPYPRLCPMCLFIWLLSVSSIAYFTTLVKASMCISKCVNCSSNFIKSEEEVIGTSSYSLLIRSTGDDLSL